MQKKGNKNAEKHLYQTSEHNHPEKKLSYKGITNFYLDKKRGLKQPMLNAETFWNRELDSEPNLDIQIQKAIDEDDSSDQSTLQNSAKPIISAKQNPTTNQQLLNNPTISEKSDQTSEYFSHKQNT